PGRPGAGPRLRPGRRPARPSLRYRAHGSRVQPPQRFDRHQGYAPSGYCSAAGWLNDECRMTRSTAWERVRQARRLAELPATADAFAAGDVNLAHVSVITRSAEQVGCEALRDAEPILLEAARRLDARQLRYVTAQLRHCLDPDGSLKDANRDYERRH